MARAYCIIPRKANEYLKLVRQGKIDYKKVMLMSRANRVSHLTSYFGESEAKNINRLIETRLIANKQGQGLVRFIRSQQNIKKTAKESMESRVKKMVHGGIIDSATLKGVVNRTVEGAMGSYVTPSQQKLITAQVDKLKKSYISDLKNATLAQREKYGREIINLSKLKSEIMAENVKAKGGISRAWDFVDGASRSLRFGLDLSAVIIQGQRTVGTKAWRSGTIKSIRALSKNNFERQQALMITHPLYEKAMSAGLNIFDYKNSTSETVEQELGKLAKIFGNEKGVKKMVGEFFDVSARTYGAFVNSLRFEMFVNMAGAKGVDTSKNSTELEQIASYVNDFTGGTRVPKNMTLLAKMFASLSRQLSIVIAPRHLLSTNPKIRIAALKRVANTMAFTYAAKAFLYGLSALLGAKQPKDENDPRSTNFGRIYAFGHWWTLNDPIYSYISIVARIVTGEQKNSNTEVFSEVDKPKAIGQFFSNKLTPVLQPIGNFIFRENRDFNYQEQDFSSIQGWARILGSMFMPSTWIEDLVGINGSEQDALAALMGFIGASTYKFDFEANYIEKDTQEITQFRTILGKEKLRQFDNDFNKEYDRRMRELVKRPSYTELDNDGKKKELTKLQNGLKKELFKKYGFKKMDHAKFLKKYPDAK